MAFNHSEQEIRAMLERFWEGDTTLAEERTLKEYFAFANVPDDLEHIAAYFNATNVGTEEILDDSFDTEVLQRIGVEPKGGAVVRPLHSLGRYWKMAAAVAVFVGLGAWLIWSQDSTDPVIDGQAIASNVDQEEVQKAFQETKKALFMLSNNFNRGSEQVKQLGKFEEAQQQVKTISHE
jgi:hypothetical protein